MKAQLPTSGRHTIGVDLGDKRKQLSADHIAYNPYSYHRGSVWTVEQATIAFGLKRYGFGTHANSIARGTFELAERYERHRLPEAVGGHPRDRQHPFPGLYPRACWPQAALRY